MTPRRKQILERARRIELSDIVRAGLPALTPEDYELKESGAFHRAKIDLMRSQKTKVFAQQRKYLDQMASEMKLKVIRAKHFRQAESGMRKIGYDWTNGWTRTKVPQKKVRRAPKPEVKRVPKPKPKKVPKTGEKIALAKFKGRMRRADYFKKLASEKSEAIALGLAPKRKAKPKKKRKKLRTERTGKTMRRLRKIDGVKVFSFPDHIWKAKPARRRRKH